MAADEKVTQIFREAIEEMGLRSVDAPKVFGVTRQTFSAWIHGERKIPKTALAILAGYQTRRSADITEAIEAFREELHTRAAAQRAEAEIIERKRAWDTLLMANQMDKADIRTTWERTGKLLIPDARRIRTKEQLAIAREILAERVRVFPLATAAEDYTDREPGYIHPQYVAMCYTTKHRERIRDIVRRILADLKVIPTDAGTDATEEYLFFP